MKNFLSKSTLVAASLLVAAGVYAAATEQAQTSPVPPNGGYTTTVESNQSAGTDSNLYEDGGESIDNESEDNSDAISEETYINVDGDEIAGPNDDSDGATAICNDGEYSHSQHHQGTCSGHGGVDEWLD